MTFEQFVDQWNESHWTQAYGAPNTRYKKGYHRGQDIGADGGDLVYAVQDMVITALGRNDSIGTWVEGQVADGTFDSFGHTRAMPGLQVGMKVLAYSPFAIVNGEDDDHGTDWDGSHIHYFNGWGSGWIGIALAGDNDPRPAIRKALQGGGGQDDEGEMKVLQIHYQSGSTFIRAVLVPGTSYFIQWSSSASTIATALSTALGIGPSAQVDEAVFNVFKNEAVEMQKGQSSSDLAAIRDLATQIKTLAEAIVKK